MRGTSTSGLLLLLIGVLGLSLFLSPSGAWKRTIDWLFSSGATPLPAGGQAAAPVTARPGADRRTTGVV